MGNQDFFKLPSPQFMSESDATFEKVKPNGEKNEGEDSRVNELDLAQFISTTSQPFFPVIFTDGILSQKEKYGKEALKKGHRSSYNHQGGEKNGTGLAILLKKHIQE